MIRVDGFATSEVPATDRGLAYGDGVFRTLAVRGGRPVVWERQHAKLASDCARLGLACPASPQLHDEILAALDGATDAAVKIIVTRGEGERGYRVPARPRPRYVVLSSPPPAYPASYEAEGITAWVCRLRLGTQPALAGIKHLNRLENVLARSEPEGDGHAEGLLCDVEGYVIGGTMSNLFIADQGRLSTPDLAASGVAGLTRELVLEWARREGVDCRVERLELARVLQADEVFLVNSLIGVWPVRAIGDRAYPPARLAHAVRASIDQTHAYR